MLLGTFGAGDYDLFRNRFDPEPRGEVGQVGDDGDEGAARVNRLPAFRNFPVEVGNDGDQQVGGMFAPIIRQQLYQRFMENADGKLKNPQQIFAAPGPTVAQEDVVLLLNANSGEAAEYIQVVGKFLELNEVNFPGTRLPLADGF